MRDVLVFKLERSGEFSVHAKDYSGQCGRHGQTIARYTVSVTGHKVNANGFLMDNNDVPAYFARYRRVRIFPSCERIAALAVQHFLTHCREQGAEPTRIYVGITVIEGSVISAEWRASL